MVNTAPRGGVGFIVASEECQIEEVAVGVGLRMCGRGEFGVGLGPLVSG